MQTPTTRNAAALDALDDHVDQAKAITQFLIGQSYTGQIDQDTLRCSLPCTACRVLWAA